MFSNLKQKLSSLTGWLVAILTLAFLFEKSKSESLEGKLQNEQTNEKDAQLASEERVVEANTAQVEAAAKKEEAVAPTKQETLDSLDKL